MTFDAREQWEGAPCGLLATTNDGRIRLVNRTFCAWTGYSAEELVDKMRFQDLLTMGGKIFHHTHWAPLMTMQGSISEVKFEIRHRDGRVLPLVVNAVRHGPVDDIAAYVARDRDRYEKELVSSRKRLEELVKETQRLHADADTRATYAEQMIGIVSHDLRNPISAIQMGAALLNDGELSDAQRRTVERITRATERATGLLADLLDFTAARLGGGIRVNPVAISLHDVVAESLEELRLANPGREIRQTRTGDGQCRGDAARIAQVVGNLVANAITYGDRLLPIIVMTTTGERCSVAVHNWGEPIPVELQARLFEPMTRAPHGASNPTRSVGLGLYIVREIARALGGDATVTSNPTDGTTFLVSWPG